MTAEVLSLLAPRGRRVIVDCTVGLGGHAEALLAAEGFEGRIVGVDRDEEALERATRRLERFGARFTPLRGNFGRLSELLEGHGCGAVDGVLFDLGVSSLQLDDPGRGFSFRHSGPLDMRMDPSAGPSAADLVAELDTSGLERVLRDFGEERHARRVAAAIVREREREPIVETGRLAEIVRRALGARSGRIDAATRTFQGLRIAVNDELGELERGLRGAWSALAPGGRLAAISFHSLEDRIVKRFLRDMALRGGARLLTKRPVRASEEETEVNPRARSARLRVAQIAAESGKCA
jgi:16S rRNA (cytosine1402-N4)-methyltransferase